MYFFIGEDEKCENYTYSQEQEVVSSVECFSDIPQSVLSRLKSTRERSCSSASETGSCQGSRSGATSAPLTDETGEGELMLSAEDSPAKTSVQREREQAWPVKDPVYGVRWPASSAKYDRATSSWKIHPCLFPEDSMSCSVTLPRWGMTVGGELSELTRPAHLISGTGSGSWPTARAADYKGATSPSECTRRRVENGQANLPEAIQESSRVMWQTPVADDAVNRKTGKFNSRGEPKLSAQVKLWPTPRTKGMCGGSGSWEKLKQATSIEEARKMGAGHGGQLNPTWVEWLMGWPLGWTDLKPLAMDKCHNVLHSHGESLGGHADD